ncbi:hypothetical protein ACIQVO_37260 [Streptomyces sp. NPDC101062]|uniref:hypothetical protein n=1 Tax=unclassified Streptomyces TaxID=2593676 RepID=UPI002E771067|nr:hypothetical protein [Streptomyces sp. JV176]MEE1798118.1 hypothetical protein [Streptomyces sp. JV176]
MTRVPDLLCPNPRYQSAPPSVLFALERATAWHETSGLPCLTGRSVGEAPRPGGHRWGWSEAHRDHAKLLLDMASTEAPTTRGAGALRFDVRDLTAEARHLGHTKTDQDQPVAAHTWGIGYLLRETTRYRHILNQLTGPGAIEAGVHWLERCAYTLAVRYPVLTPAAARLVMRGEAEAELALCSRRGIHPLHVPPVRPGPRSVPEAVTDPSAGPAEQVPQCEGHPGARGPLPHTSVRDGA